MEPNFGEQTIGKTRRIEKPGGGGVVERVRHSFDQVDKPQLGNRGV